MSAVAKFELRSRLVGPFPRRVVGGYSPGHLLAMVFLISFTFLSVPRRLMMLDRQVVPADNGANEQILAQNQAAEHPLPLPTSQTAKTLMPLQSNFQPPLTKTRQWKQQKNHNLPVFENYVSDLRKYHFIFVSSREDEKFKLKQSRPAQQSLESWRRWAAYFNFSTDRCDWKNLLQCQKTFRNRIFVILPGNWNFKAIDKLISQGENIILFGMPFQIYERKKSISFRNLLFERYHKEVQNWLIVKGDESLTLGIEPGLRLNIPPIHTSYRVRSERPSAVSIGPDGLSPPVRLDVIKDPRARVIWMDFWPEVKGPSDIIQAGIFRYLLRKKHWTFSNWPYKALMASTLFLESTHLSKDLPEVRKTLASLQIPNIPISWIVLTSGKPQSVTPTENDHFYCQISFLKTHDIKSANHLVEECRKRINLQTGRDAIGISSYDSPLKNLAFDALANNRLKILVSLVTSGPPIPYVQRAEKDHLVVIPANYNTLRALGAREADRHFKLARNTGGFSNLVLTAEQFLANPRVFKELVDRLANVNGKLVSSAELGEWKISREKLLNGESVAVDAQDKRRPYTIQVNEQGQISESHLYSNERQPASESDENEE